MQESLPFSTKALVLGCVVLLGVLCPAAASGQDIQVSLLDGTNGLVIYGRDSGDRSGYSVSSGDFNGDGYSDLLIGAFGADGSSNSASDAGETYVVFGKPSGWTASIDVGSGCFLVLCSYVCPAVWLQFCI